MPNPANPSRAFRKILLQIRRMLPSPANPVRARRKILLQIRRKLPNPANPSRAFRKILLRIRRAMPNPASPSRARRKKADVLPFPSAGSASVTLDPSKMILQPVISFPIQRYAEKSQKLFQSTEPVQAMVLGKMTIQQ